MTLLIAITVVFLLVEVANIWALYFNTGSHRFNAIGVFAGWEGSKEHPEVHDLVRYLAYWVAGVKLIFILVMAAVLIFGDDRMRVVATGALALATVSYFWRLGPLIRSIDRSSQLTVPGYSRVLDVMVAGLLAGLVVAVVSGAVSL